VIGDRRADNARADYDNVVVVQKRASASAATRTR
jgi:hypothetical protein